VPTSFVLPDWVCWIAQDADGAWWGYQVEPNLSHKSWYENEVGNCIRLNLDSHLDAGQPNPHWAATLKRMK
jgi:hypothetical protein